MIFPLYSLLKMLHPQPHYFIYVPFLVPPSTLPNKSVRELIIPYHKMPRGNSFYEGKEKGKIRL